MTTAVCIHCGAMKFGALTPCTKCQFCPETPEDKAKSIVLSDHYVEEEELQRLAERIKAGQEVIYPEELLNNYIRAYEEDPNAGAPSVGVEGCVLFLAGIAAVIVGALAWVVVRALK